MSEVVFLDTSVLTNLLDVPRRNSDRGEVATQFKGLVERKATFVIPFAAVIETGNHIAQCEGHARRQCTSRLADFLRAACSDRPPWVISGMRWDREELATLVDGWEGGLPLIGFAEQGIGAGDASILLEMRLYRARVPSGQPVRLWTLDTGLAPYA